MGGGDFIILERVADSLQARLCPIPAQLIGFNGSPTDNTIHRLNPVMFRPFGVSVFLLIFRTTVGILIINITVMGNMNQVHLEQPQEHGC